MGIFIPDNRIDYSIDILHSPPPRMEHLARIECCKCGCSQQSSNYEIIWEMDFGAPAAVINTDNFTGFNKNKKYQKFRNGYYIISIVNQYGTANNVWCDKISGGGILKNFPASISKPLNSRIIRIALSCRPVCVTGNELAWILKSGMTPISWSGYDCFFDADELNDIISSSFSGGERVYLTLVCEQFYLLRSTTYHMMIGYNNEYIINKIRGVPLSNSYYTPGGKEVSEEEIRECCSTFSLVASCTNDACSLSKLFQPPETDSIFYFENKEELESSTIPSNANYIYRFADKYPMCNGYRYQMRGGRYSMLSLCGKPRLWSGSPIPNNSAIIVVSQAPTGCTSKNKINDSVETLNTYKDVFFDANQTSYSPLNFYYSSYINGSTWVLSQRYSYGRAYSIKIQNIDYTYKNSWIYAPQFISDETIIGEHYSLNWSISNGISFSSTASNASNVIATMPVTLWTNGGKKTLLFDLTPAITSLLNYNFSTNRDSCLDRPINVYVTISGERTNNNILPESDPYWQELDVGEITFYDPKIRISYHPADNPLIDSVVIGI